MPALVELVEFSERGASVDSWDVDSPVDATILASSFSNSSRSDRCSVLAACCESVDGAGALFACDSTVSWPVALAVCLEVDGSSDLAFPFSCRAN